MVVQLCQTQSPSSSNLSLHIVCPETLQNLSLCLYSQHLMTETFILMTLMKSVRAILSQTPTKVMG